MQLKEIKKIRKEYLAIILITIIIGTVLLLSNKAIVRAWHEMNVDQECVDDINIAIQYPGEINVRFVDDVNEEEATHLVNSLGLSLSFDSLSTIYVPEGKEKIWFCILNNLDILESVGFSGPAKLT